MKRTQTLKLAALCAVPALTALGSILAIVALTAGGEARLGPLPLMKMGPGYAREAESILAPGVLPPPTERRRAIALSRATLQEQPYSTAAWLRIAYVDALDNGLLTAAGLEAVRRSYDLAPIDIGVGVWRVRFVLTYGGRLPPELHESVRQEVLALSRAGRRRKELEDVAATLGNPVNRLRLSLWLRQAERGAAR